MSQRNRYTPRHIPRHIPRRRRKQSSCGVPVTLLVLLVVGVALFAPPDLLQQMRQMIGQQIVPQDEVEERIETLAEQALPTLVADLPPAGASDGQPLPAELRITEEEINAHLASQPESLDPLESVTIHFVPGQVRIDLLAYGITGRVTSGLAAQDGRVAVINPQFEGPLGPYITIDDLAASLEQHLNAQLLAQGRTFRDVRIEQGSLILVLD